MASRGYAIDQSPIYKLSSKRKLATILQVEYASLLHSKDWINYTVSEIEKGSGGFRTIYDPCRKLKQVQRRIKNLLSRISFPNWVFSGRKGVCHVDNGKHHEHSVYFIQSDLHAFYDSCSRERVYRLFKDRFKCSSDVSALLSDLTTLTLQDGSTVIPTGSPCAQLVAFFAYQDMFNELHNLARNHGCKFSLYVDDLTFSSKMPFSNPAVFKKKLLQIVKRYGHSLSLSKTAYRGADETKIVTGVAITKEGVSAIPNKLRYKIVQGTAQSCAGDTSTALSTLGRISSARMIEPSSFPEAERQGLLSLEDYL